MEDKDILLETLRFHGHRCWASVAGVRVRLAALRALDVPRAGGTQLYAILETGEEHGGMCFGDGVQYTTGCTFGKGNIRKQPLGKLAVTLIDKATDRAVRVSYKPPCKNRSPNQPSCNSAQQASRPTKSRKQIRWRWSIWSGMPLRRMC